MATRKRASARTYRKTCRNYEAVTISGMVILRRGSGGGAVLVLAFYRYRRVERIVSFKASTQPLRTGTPEWAAEPKAHWPEWRKPPQGPSHAARGGHKDRFRYPPERG